MTEPRPACPACGMPMVRVSCGEASLLVCESPVCTGKAPEPAHGYTFIGVDRATGKDYSAIVAPPEAGPASRSRVDPCPGCEPCKRPDCDCGGCAHSDPACPVAAGWEAEPVGHCGGCYGSLPRCPEGWSDYECGAVGHEPHRCPGLPRADAGLMEDIANQIGLHAEDDDFEATLQQIERRLRAEASRLRGPKGGGDA